MDRLIPEKETLTIEFKSDKKKYPDSEIFDAVVSFANTEGGDLYLGVEDSGEITGAHRDHLNPITLSAYIANNTVPPVSIRAEVIEDSFPVLKISVPKSFGGIVATSSGKMMRRQIKADGTPENIPMYPTEVSTRLSDLRLLDYSAMLLQEATIEDFDLLELERLRRSILSYDGDKVLLELSDVDLYKALGFVKNVGGNLVPTVTGMLLIGKVESIKRFIPTSSAVFQVLEGTSIKLNDDFVLPILSAFEKISTYFMAWNPEIEIEMGMYRMSVPDFNKRALREAIVNAFAHRDYTRMGRVRVSVTDEGMTIANPGGFIEGVTYKNLLTAEPHGRNPLLADALKRIGLAERTGRGIDRIFEGSLIYGRMLPDYSASTAVTVSLFIPRCAPDFQIAQIVSNEQNRLGRPMPINTLLVLNALRDLPRSNVHQLAEAVNLTETMVKSILDKAIETNLVEAYGSGRGRNYILSSRIYAQRGKKSSYIQHTDIDETRYLELISKMAENYDFISRSDVMQLLHVSENQAYRLLKKLVERDILVAVNKGRYAKYAMKK